MYHSSKARVILGELNGGVVNNIYIYGEPGVLFPNRTVYYGNHAQLTEGPHVLSKRYGGLVGEASCLRNRLGPSTFITRPFVITTSFLLVSVSTRCSEKCVFILFCFRPVVCLLGLGRGEGGT